MKAILPITFGKEEEEIGRSFLGGNGDDTASVVGRSPARKSSPPPGVSLPPPTPSTSPPSS